MHVLVATDADWIVDAVVAALGDDDTHFTVCREGRQVTQVIEERAAADGSSPFDLAILDLQVGTMGGMAITMSLRLDESAGVLPHVQVLMLLDREADIHLARRSGAEGWLVKPLDPLRLRRAALAVARGDLYHHGVPVEVTMGIGESDASAADEAPGDGGSGRGEAADVEAGEPATAGA